MMHQPITYLEAVAAKGESASAIRALKMSEDAITQHERWASTCGAARLMIERLGLNQWGGIDEIAAAYGQPEILKDLDAGRRAFVAELAR